VTTPPPVPATPPTSEAVVAAQLSLEASEENLAKLAATVAAVNAVVPRMATTAPAAQALGAAMLAARLWRRRNSPEGVATFTADGAVYVQRNDPDVALLLGIGPYAPPVVG
jgi:hypothetical protein